jgi:hypothetical protein
MPADPIRTTVTVHIADGEQRAPFSSVQLVVHPVGSQTIIADGVTGTDGSATLPVPAGGPYVVEATWLGDQGDLESASTSSEFVASADAELSLDLHGPFGTVSGTVSAVDVNGTVADLSGAELLIFSGLQVVQRLPLGADGSFASTALPTTDQPGYRLGLVPPPAYEQAHGDSAGLAFALPQGASSPSSLQFDACFELITAGGSGEGNGADAGAPECSEGEQPGTGEGEQPGEPEVPEEPEFPDLPEGVMVVGSADGDAAADYESTGDALLNISEDEFDSLLAETDASAAPVVLMNASGEVLGFVQQLDAPQAAHMTASAASVSQIGSISAIGAVPGFTGVDVETALIMVTNDRVTGLEGQLQSQLQESLEQTQQRNERLQKLNAAYAALAYFEAVMTQANLDAAQHAVAAASIEDPFLDATLESADGVLAGANAQVDSEKAEVAREQALRLSTLQEQMQEDAARALQSAIIRGIVGIGSGAIQVSTSTSLGMRSEPIDLGTLQWQGGALQGPLDLSRVPRGQHHLIMNFAELGFTTVSPVAVSDGPAVPSAPSDENSTNPDQSSTEAITRSGSGASGSLAATGSTANTAPLWTGAVLLALGALVLAGAELQRRRRSART